VVFDILVQNDVLVIYKAINHVSYGEILTVRRGGVVIYKATNHVSYSEILMVRKGVYIKNGQVNIITHLKWNSANFYKKIENTTLSFY